MDDHDEYSGLGLSLFILLRVQTFASIIMEYGNIALQFYVDGGDIFSCSGAELQ